ncbi:MAG: chromate transporter [Pseudorhodoplanes sp.]
MKPDPLWSLAAHMALLSIFAIGGANAAVPEMHRLAVEVNHWMTDRQFSDMFALAQLSPGPNVIIVTLIGYHVAGFLGAFVATVAMCGPTCFAAYCFSRLWTRFNGAPWQTAIQVGLIPISVGLISAAALILAQTTVTNWVAVAIMLATAAFSYFTRFNPLWMFVVAGAMGFAGFLD